jgi:hypothetical protein
LCHIHAFDHSVACRPTRSSAVQSTFPPSLRFSEVLFCSMTVTGLVTRLRGQWYRQHEHAQSGQQAEMTFIERALY